MGLSTYWKKRDFKKTPEPSGKAASRSTSGAKRRPTRTSKLTFIIQKHAASRLHYDFRLELDGVLLSWAVPKGPSLDPSQKRLAVRVEDHPLAYGSFEGTIPKGEYGGGTVMLWDRGTWTPEGDPREGERKGKLTFSLDGEKLKGRFTLVRTHGRGSDDDGKSWLLFKDKDELARSDGEADLLEERPESVKTGRSMDEIAEDKKAQWSSKAKKTAAKTAPTKAAAKTAPTKAAAKTAPTKAAAKTAKEATKKGASKAAKARSSRTSEWASAASSVEGAEKAPLPESIEPELATLVDRGPIHGDWIYELKYDGYRVLIWLSGGEARFITRNGNDWTQKLSPLRDAALSLPVKEAILDGELVVVRPDGTTDFQALQNALSNQKKNKLTYFSFDLLYLDGYDLRDARLIDRKALLAKLLDAAPADGPIRYSDHIEGDADAVVKSACKLSLEGVVAKLRGSPYRSGRVNDWLKLKCGARQEFVIGGYTDPNGARSGFGALLIGYYDKDGELHYAGKVGTGFNEATLRDLEGRLSPLEKTEASFSDPPRMPRVHWVSPKLVAEVAFTEWTGDGHLRHPSFQGLREDRDPRTVVRERGKLVAAVSKRNKPHEAALRG